MELQQSFEVPSGAERVWAWFKDVEAVVECLPGASLRAPPDDGKLQLAMVVKLGPITANFVGVGEARFDDASRSGSVEGAATDRKSASRIKGRVNFALTEVANDASPVTHVALAIDYSMGGALAQFSREGIVRELAQRMTDAFASNLRKKLEAAGDAATGVGTATPAPTGMPAAAPATAAPAAATEDGQSVAPRASDSSVAGATTTASEGAIRSAPPARERPVESRPPAASFNFGALLWTVIVDRLRRWLGLAPRR